MKARAILTAITATMALGVFPLLAHAGPPSDHRKCYTETLDNGMKSRHCYYVENPNDPSSGGLNSSKTANQSSSSGTDTRHRVCEKVWSAQFNEYTEKCHMEAGPGVNQHSASPQIANQPPPPPVQQPQQATQPPTTSDVTNVINGIKGLFRK